MADSTGLYSTVELSPEPLLSPGFQLDLGLDLFVGGRSIFGVHTELSWRKYGSSEYFGEQATARDIAISVGPMLSTNNNPGRFVNFKVAPMIGYRDFEFTVGRDGLGTGTFNFGVFAAVTFRVFDELRLGPAVRFLGALPLDIESTEIEFLYSLSLMATYRFGRDSAPTVAAVPSTAPVVAPSYVMVSASTASEVTERDRPELTETPAYIAARRNYRTVAVLAPDRCANQSVSQTTGQGGGAGEVLATQCGVEMGEIESVLARMGYQVISWRTMPIGPERAMARERAAALGAHVLFQVNSLERSENMTGVVQTGARYDYFHSDRYGRRGPPAALRALDADRLEQMVGGPGTGGGGRAGAGLDLQAMDVDTGMMVWTYRWRRLARTSGANRAEQLFRGDPDPNTGYMMWERAYPEPMGAGAAPSVAPQEQYRTGSSQSATQNIGQVDERQVLLFELLRGIVTDAVRSFRCTAGGDVSIDSCQPQ